MLIEEEGGEGLVLGPRIGSTCQTAPDRNLYPRAGMYPDGKGIASSAVRTGFTDNMVMGYNGMVAQRFIEWN